MLTSLLAIAFASPRSDLAVHSVGLQGGWSSGIGKGDLDLLVGERLRWTLTKGVGVHLDGRFIIDPDGVPALERYRVRRLGVELTANNTRVLLGRFIVPYGGARLVDGVQLVQRIGTVELGAWGGLAPDLFTTAPRLRPGFGPVVAVVQSTWRASVVGEALFAEGGIDRLAVLAMARLSPGRVFTADGRLDIELLGADDRPHLSDGRLSMRIRPSNGFSFGVFYDAFSSLKYLRTEPLDPELRRFDQRILDQGIALGLDQDVRDPSINHLVGANLSWRRSEAGIGPLTRIRARYRHHPEPDNRFAQLGLQLGIAEGAGKAELAAVANGRFVDDRFQLDAGIQGAFDFAGGRCRIDASGLALLDPDVRGTPGMYADLFFDAITDFGLSVGIGANTVVEPVDTEEVGVTAFTRLTWHQRRKQDGKDAQDASFARPDDSSRTPSK